MREYADRYDWIRVVKRLDRGERKVGPGVIEAFEAGMAQAELEDPEFLCKLDMDLELPSGYFEGLVERMRADSRLGTLSGKPYYVGRGGKLVSERIGDDMSAGMTKFYRKSCFDQIGGFVGEVMWDGIDCHRCRMLGWSARSTDEPKLRFTHLRPMGSSQKSWLTGRMRHGYGQWFMGTGLSYMTVSALYRATRPPYIIGGVAMWLGYVFSWIRQRPRWDEPGFRRFLRSYQWRVLVYGKQRTLEMLHATREESWKRANATSGVASPT